MEIQKRKRKKRQVSDLYLQQNSISFEVLVFATSDIIACISEAGGLLPIFLGPMFAPITSSVQTLPQGSMFQMRTFIYL